VHCHRSSNLQRYPNPTILNTVTPSTAGYFLYIFQGESGAQSSLTVPICLKSITRSASINPHCSPHANPQAKPNEIYSICFIENPNSFSLRCHRLRLQHFSHQFRISRNHFQICLGCCIGLGAVLFPITQSTYGDLIEFGKFLLGER
jgi:hypothetical protein